MSELTLTAVDTSNDDPPQPEQMHCMEVWGGNTAADKCFEMPGLKAWIYSRPYGMSAGGGDVHYLSSCASGRITRILLADVSGHGEKVSDVAMVLNELMRDNVNLIRQSRLVRAVNREFTNSDFTGKFATAVIGTYFSPTRSYEFCNAGHPPPLLYRADSKTWTILERVAGNGQEQPPNLPFGIESETEYQQQSVKLNPGDAILTYSDALIESVTADGELLMPRGVLDIVHSIGMSRPEAFIPQLVAGIRDMSPENLTGDDTTIILCQATQSKPSLKNNLLAPFRLLRRAASNTALEAGNEKSAPSNSL